MTNDDLEALEAQGDLLPFASAESVLAMLRRQERRILTISPELSRRQALLLMAEGALFDLLLDSVERDVMNSPEYKARQEFQATRTLEILKESPSVKRRRRGLGLRVAITALLANLSTVLAAVA